MHLLNKHYGNFVEVKDRLDSEDEDIPYRSVFCVFKYKDVLAEVQFHPTPVEPLKKKISHTLYEVIR
jgi:hypothetical protein